tara:strand:+ start:171 stop:653 length:483 start_codon:yes stop_codon:yes gene_type:complete
MEQNKIYFKNEDIYNFFEKKVLDIIKEDNEYFHLDGLELNIGYHFDSGNLDSDFTDDEDEFWGIINFLYKMLPEVKHLIEHSFEIVYYSYSSESDITLIKYDKDDKENKILYYGGWPGEFCPDNEDEDEFSAQVDNELYDGIFSDELREKIIESGPLLKK